MIQTAKRLDSVQEYYFSTKLKEIAEQNAQGCNIINLGIGSPDLPAAPEVVAELGRVAALPTAHSYQSYVGVPALRQAFAEWYLRCYGVELNATNEILPLLGSKEGIMHVSMAYLEAGDEVLIPNPGYPTYRSASLLAGATLVEYELNEANHWLPDLKALEQRDLSKVKLMWINYPQMPTGALPTKAFFEKIIAFAKKHNILIINDNPYSFILNKQPMSLLAVEGAKAVALELNSLSKSQNMAGWRVGMLAGNAEILSNVLRFKSNMDSGMFLPVQLAAIKALELPQTWYDNLNVIYQQRQQKVFQLLDLLECVYDKNQAGMFVWAKIPSHYATGYELSDKILYNCNVFITPGGIFGSQGDGYIRVSLCASVEVFEQAIERVLS
jgi:LL-diaminopimelate aminotransferase